MPDLLMWWSLGVPALMIGVAALSGLIQHYGRVQLWERSAKVQCRDSEVKTSMVPRAQVTARSGPNEVRITGARGQSKAVEVEIEGPEGFSVVKLRRQHGKPRTPEIVIGDESFDDQFVIDGPVLAVAARLDETMRRRLLSALSGCTSLEIGGGRLRVEMREKALRRLLPILLDIGRRLAEPVPVERRIAENARRDSVPGVRIFNLLLLARERPGDPETLAVLREACADERPEVRLRAAIELGEEGRGVLRHLAEKSVHDESAAQAVSLLGSALSFESLREILDRALPSLSKRKGGLVRTAHACLEELGRRGTAAVGVLAQVAATEQPELAAAAAQALGATGEASAEPPLLQALQSEDDGLRGAAAAALGRVGTAAAVQPLQEAAERSWLDLSLRRAARQAIAEIQSRLVDAAPGQLSLAGAGTEMGRLSLADGDAGQLSLAPEIAGEPALLPHGVETEGPPAEGATQRVWSRLS